MNEIIRNVPNVPDTYQLLGQIYEDQNDIKKVSTVGLGFCSGPLYS